MESEPLEPRAPEGAHCAEHPEREAQFTCPRCGSYACIPCWQPSLERCMRCLKRDPTEAAAPIAWEMPERSWLARYFATLGSAFSPVRTAPAFARPDIGAARNFALLSALPLALLAGVIPHTRTLMFEGSLVVRVLDNATSAQIAFDVVRAMLVQVSATGLELLCLLLPFTSLVRAYAPNRQHAAIRVLYYRLWLLPASMLTFYALGWVGPMGDPQAQVLSPLQFAAMLSAMMGLMLLSMAMGATARLACGIGPFMSMIVVLVPLFLLLAVEPMVAMGLGRVLPPMPASMRPAG